MPLKRDTSTASPRGQSPASPSHPPPRPASNDQPPASINYYLNVLKPELMKQGIAYILHRRGFFTTDMDDNPLPDWLKSMQVHHINTRLEAKIIGYILARAHKGESLAELEAGVKQLPNWEDFVLDVRSECWSQVTNEGYKLRRVRLSQEEIEALGGEEKVLRVYDDDDEEGGPKIGWRR